MATAPQARVLNLRDPTAKMSKSNPDPRTRILLTDPPALARDKLRTAVTDSRADVTYSPADRPGVSNLLSILSGLTDRPPAALEADFQGKTLKQLKEAVGDALEPLLVRFQSEFGRIRDDQAYLAEVERRGRDKARQKAGETMERVRKAVGLDY